MQMILPYLFFCQVELIEKSRKRYTSRGDAIPAFSVPIYLIGNIAKLYEAELKLWRF